MSVSAARAFCPGSIQILVALCLDQALNLGAPSFHSLIVKGWDSTAADAHPIEQSNLTEAKARYLFVFAGGTAVSPCPDASCLPGHFAQPANSG
jgi:hypothetical protein